MYLNPLLYGPIAVIILAYAFYPLLVIPSIIGVVVYLAIKLPKERLEVIVAGLITLGIYLVAVPGPLCPVTSYEEARRCNDRWRLYRLGYKCKRDTISNCLAKSMLVAKTPQACLAIADQFYYMRPHLGYCMVRFKTDPLYTVLCEKAMRESDARFMSRAQCLIEGDRGWSDSQGRSLLSLLLQQSCDQGDLRGVIEPHELRYAMGQIRSLKLKDQTGKTPWDYTCNEAQRAVLREGGNF